MNEQATSQTEATTQSESAKLAEFVRVAFTRAFSEREALVARNRIPVLDGTPYAIVVTGDDGRDRVAGEWPDLYTGALVKGFLDVDAVPSHLSGAYLSSLEGTAKRVEKLVAAGNKARAVHRRELEARKLTQLDATLKGLRHAWAELAKRDFIGGLAPLPEEVEG